VSDPTAPSAPLPDETAGASEAAPAPPRERLGRRRGIALVVAIALVMAAGGVGFAFVTRGAGEAAADDNPMLEVPPTTRATTTVPATTTTVALPVPEPPPADPYADVPIIELGVISIPKIGLEHKIYEGVTLTVINEGPGHWPGTAMPGELGNTVFPGHRTTYSRPFHDLDLLAPGDEVIFHMPEEDHVYRVRETLIVAPTDLWVVDQSYEQTFTLIACHPKGSARQRIVVKGDLVASIPRAQPPAGA
jgi:sortase A